VASEPEPENPIWYLDANRSVAYRPLPTSHVAQSPQLVAKQRLNLTFGGLHTAQDRHLIA